MPTLRTASAEEKAAYKTTKPVYPLYGFVTVSNGQHLVWCPVEDLRAYAGSDEPKYEIMAPAGFHFSDEGTHSVLCRTRREIFLQASTNGLARCTARCNV